MACAAATSCSSTGSTRSSPARACSLQKPQRNTLRLGAVGSAAAASQMNSSTTTGRPQVGQRRHERLLEGPAQLVVAARVRRQRGDAGVEVAQVGRPHDDLGEETRQGGRLARVDATKGADGVPGHPATAAMEIDDDVARRGSSVQLGDDDVLRRRRREALEGGQLRTRIRPDQGGEGVRHRLVSLVAAPNDVSLAFTHPPTSYSRGVSPVRRMDLMALNRTRTHADYSPSGSNVRRTAGFGPWAHDLGDRSCVRRIRLWLKGPDSGGDLYSADVSSVRRMNCGQTSARRITPLRLPRRPRSALLRRTPRPWSGRRGRRGRCPRSPRPLRRAPARPRDPSPRG